MEINLHFEVKPLPGLHPFTYMRRTFQDDVLVDKTITMIYLVDKRAGHFLLKDWNSNSVSPITGRWYRYDKA